MAAGDVYDAYFNSAKKGGIRTSQVYDPIINEWMQLVRNYVHTGALWVPQKGAVGGETLAQLVPGTANIGAVGIDQTTPGITNGVQVNASALPTGAATSLNQASLEGKIDAIDTVLDLVLAKIIEAPATEAKQDALKAVIDAIVVGTSPATVALSGSASLKGAVATVLAAGTRVQLPNFPCREVTIIARRANTGNIYVGGNDVSSAVYGVNLSAEQSFTFMVNNTSILYIDSSVGGEGISYVAIQ